MKLSEFREHTKDFDGDVEITVAAGMTGIRAIETGEFSAGEKYPRTAKVYSIAAPTDAVILEL